MAYAIVGWILIEVSSTVLPTFQAPEWVLQTITFLIVLGFPLALLLSWAYELTPEGMKLERDVAAGESITQVTGRKLDFAIIGALVLALGFVVYNYVLEDGSDELPEVAVIEPEQAVLPNSVAVLPFENLSLDPEDAFFAVGIHDAILNELAKLQNMNVIARTSVLRYADGQTPISEIAEELNVETVMEGSVQYADGRILVTAQLIDPGTNAHLWSDSYNREFSDIFAIQADIAMNIANALEAEFSLNEQESIEAVPTESPAAYALYLRAVSVGFGTNVVEVASQYLDGAIGLDPNFALAYARKAHLHATILTGNAPGQQAEYEQVAQQSAERALALDPTLAGPHVALAFVHQAHWRWAEAEQAFEQALSLSPNDAAFLSEYSRTKRYRGEYDVSIEAGRRATELDPQSAQSHYQLGISYRYARNYDAAVEAFRDVIELEPSSSGGHAWLAYSEISRGNWVDGTRELELAEQLYGERILSIRISQLATAYAQLGRRDDVERLFAALEARAESSPVNAALWALMYIALEDYDQALEWLAVAVDDEAPDLVPLGEIKANPYADPVLDEPRFQDLRDRIGT